MEPVIKTHEQSDYGYYGTTGIFKKADLPTKECCGEKPTLYTEYEDTPGMRETTYVLKCEKCDKVSFLTSGMDFALDSWNDEAVYDATVEKVAALKRKFNARIK